MGKASRNKRIKAERELANLEITPIPLNKVKDNHSYWITGYYWKHDTVVVEPFNAVRRFGTWTILNIKEDEMDFWEATALIKGNGTMLIFEDRVIAMDACEAIENNAILLESFAKFMTEEDLVEYVAGKEV